jgi:hypothetical protein
LEFILELLKSYWGSGHPEAFDQNVQHLENDLETFGRQGSDV